MSFLGTFSTLIWEHHNQHNATVKNQLLQRLHDLFDASIKPPATLFDPDDNEPYENPDWPGIFSACWDDVPIEEIRMNWDAYYYFTETALCYFFPVILKIAITDPDAVDFLQGHFLCHLLSGDSDNRQIVARYFDIRHWELMREVICQKEYLEFCENYELLKEQNASVNFLMLLIARGCQSS